MTRRTVLSVAYPLAPVGRDSAGGAEQVLAALDLALVAAGHRSVVVACSGSVVAGELHAIPDFAAPGGMIDEQTRARAQRATAATLGAVLARKKIDIVHLHGIDFAAYLPPPGPPALVTLHLPPEWYSADALAPARPRTWLHGVSASQDAALRARLGGAPQVLPPVPNGVPVAALASAERRRRTYVLSLGRICPEKGQHLAIAAARAAGAPLLLAGQVFPYPEHRAYFEAMIAPELDPRCRFVGPVGFAAKRRLLAGARCLLVPSLAAETSSLVAMEALACGTPVIALRRGALPEIVEHGRTGFVVDDVAGMASAIRAVSEIDPEVCRAAARERFELAHSTAAYLALYDRLSGAATERSS